MENTTGGTAVAYIRTASYAMPDTSSAVENQKRICETQAQRLGVTITQTYVDNGVSGLASSRPGLDRMLADLATGRIGYVVVADVARLARSSALASRLAARIGELGAKLAIAKK